MNPCKYCEKQENCQEQCEEKKYEDIVEALDKRQFMEWGTAHRASRYIRKQENIGNSQNDNGGDK